MGIKSIVIISIILILVFSPSVLVVDANENVVVKIIIPGEQPVTRFDSPVVVAGIWHQFDITFENSNYFIANIKLYKGNVMPVSQRDDTNFYEFSYNDNTKTWTDLKKYDGYSYINEDECDKNGNSIVFCIGIKDTFPDDIFYYENWTLEIYKDSSKIFTNNIVIEKPKPGLSRTHDDTINFYLTPFKSEVISKNPENLNDEYFIIENVGNIPLIIYLDYGAYNSSVVPPVSSRRLSPKNTINYYLTVHGQSWKPGILRIPGTVIGSVPSDLIITTSAYILAPSIETTAAILKINVGHSDYIIGEIPDSSIVFQYQDKIEMNEGQTKDLVVYVSGEGYVKLDIQADGTNIKILKITSKDQTGSPLLINSKNTSEYAVTLRIHALRENKVGVITYDLEVDGKINTYSTKVSIGPPIGGKVEELNIPVSTIFVVICIIIVIIYMALAQIRHKRR